MGKWSIVSNNTSHKDWATAENSILVEPDHEFPVYDGVFFKKESAVNHGVFYGMTEDNMIAAFEKAEKFALYPTVDNSYLTFEELETQIKELHTDKDGKLVLLYATNKEEQYSYIEAAKEKGYTVLLLDSPIAPHLMQKLEGSKENVTFSRVDADAVENLIKKEDSRISKLSE